MRIDAHHHLWRYEPNSFGWIVPGSAIARDFAAEDLRAALDGAGLDAAIAVQARQSPEETSFLLDAARRSPAIMGVVGWIDLRAPNIAALLDENDDPLIVGYRHVVQDEGEPDFLLAEPFIYGVRAVAERGLSYDLLVNHAQLETVPHFLDRVGEGRFVLDHAAKPDIARQGWQPWADRISAVAERQDVWCKVSGLVTEADHVTWTPDDVERYLDHVLAVFGPERLIWGSDWPVCLLAASYERVVDLVADFVARRCPHAEAEIFGGNALRAYAIGRGR
ncbi:L-fuconolactonase [Sphingomonas sp. PP-CE-1A-559]|uniref:amidohydrolase family protein n=1 Tax=Sphingomonas sp. PP-CE-1A-559 TaxID=2135657 RepID=UPI00105493CB|nr:amidohydrolase family protein [Sphingomonas sp. PP-CE-1A-559]TCP86007.1 L-fuconolactonase [Sphingomonas sp. PP-CE-1A-559]